MASFRPDRVASLIRNITADLIANKLQDPRISPMTSLTRVEVSRDLVHAKIFVTVMGTDGQQRATMAGLNRAQGLIQRTLARSLRIRQCPHIRFELDQSIKKSAEILRLIEENAPPPSPDSHDSSNARNEVPDSTGAQQPGSKE